MSDAFLIFAGVVGSAFFVFLGPVIITRMNNRQALRIKQEDWRRQDEVAAAAAAANQAMVQSQAAIVSVGALTIAKLTEVQEQGTITHALVNSAYTASLEATRVALTGQLEALIRAGGSDPSSHDTNAFETIQKQIKALEITIADRLAAQTLAEAQVATKTTSTETPPTFTVPVSADIPVYPDDQQTAGRPLNT